ncbi:MAG: lytic transglycosylase domain-containing protein [Acidobacteria bacterium]|nr:lytic transglycosylase domain-containing protein [Acidobacteriota bacterium]
MTFAQSNNKRTSIRLLIGLLAALAGMGGAFLPAAQAADRIAAYLDSRGRVVFVNQARNPSPPKQATSGQARTAARSNLDHVIQRSANRHQVDPDLVRAIVRVESNYNPYAVSSRGAQGLMQLIPATARRFGVRDAFDPSANLEGGIRYLKHLMELYDGDLELVLAAYNAGENAVSRYNGVPPFRETRNYLRKISQIYPLDGPLDWQKRGVPEVVKFVDSKGIVHFSNMGMP